MERAFLETIGLFAAPFVLFALYLVVRSRYPLTLEHWTRGRVGWLTVTGLAAAVLGLMLLNATAPRGHGVYIPAHIENGSIVPGRFE
jgi:Na+/H+-dicarboxylate symporter